MTDTPSSLISLLNAFVAASTVPRESSMMNSMFEPPSIDEPLISSSANWKPSHAGAPYKICGPVSGSATPISIFSGRPSAMQPQLTAATSEKTNRLRILVNKADPMGYVCNCELEESLIKLSVVSAGKKSYNREGWQGEVILGTPHSITECNGFSAILQ